MAAATFAVRLRPVRIVLLCETFCKKMGYLQNMLPKYWARLGLEVHVVTTDLPPYYQRTDFKETYAEFTNSAGLAAQPIEPHDGYTLHVLPHQRVLDHIRFRSLHGKLSSIKPDIVQTMTPIGWAALDAGRSKLLLGYKLFTANHHHASVFPLAHRDTHFFSTERLSCSLNRTVPGRLVGLLTEKCYAIAPDCAEIAVRFFGVPRAKVCISSLGVDTEIFHPVANEAERSRRLELRRRLGYSESDIVCVYSGRFSEDKNPLLLADAVESLAKGGRPYRGLFIGNGVQASSIQARASCQVQPFVPVHELGDLFRAADVGVWPTQESMSMLDASACGIPIIANDTMSVPERLDGSGLSYRMNDVGDLSRVLVQLEELATRGRLGSCGARRIARDFSWETVARRRLADYETALGGTSALRPRSKSSELLNSAD
jgi:glycosyltransferase involved in cell wall biosynthesis